jgi:hypothetical protein
MKAPKTMPYRAVPGEDGLEPALIVHRVQGVDHPGIHGARVEGVAEPEQRRGDRERNDAAAGEPEPQVQQRREDDDADGEEVRHAAAQCVGDHAGRHLEHHLRHRVRRVHQHDLENVEPHRQQEQGVDAPDERLRQRRAGGDAEVRADDAARGHRGCVPRRRRNQRL